MKHQPPKCHCFGGHCWPHVGCPWKAQFKANKADKPKKANVAKEPKEGYTVNGEFKAAKGPKILAWRAPENE
jgi:hypothetical protein